MTIQLTPAQHAILVHAHEHTEGKITWFPDNLNGSARKKVLDAMVKRALIKQTRNTWNIAFEGYKALGLPGRAPISEKALDAVIEHAESRTRKNSKYVQGKAPISLNALDAVIAQAKPRTRENSKQAQVIAMLKRPEGATIAQICEATGWQPHTVRGTFAGAFKKKLDLSIVSDKAPGGERVYRID
ncbi:DUF3489 domain-containing protein [Xanthomonas albilineans]|uniref:DUF3489 domain-containing protein n=5 Tax=Xanthomonas albilineans TaxID=29447 RepID=UPI0005F3510B|nr:DUF3489 domain-containing protein [Xanthomonas albilineans]